MCLRVKKEAATSLRDLFGVVFFFFFFFPPLAPSNGQRRGGERRGGGVHAHGAFGSNVEMRRMRMMMRRMQPGGGRVVQ